MKDLCIFKDLRDISTKHNIWTLFGSYDIKRMVSKDETIRICEYVILHSSS